MAPGPGDTVCQGRHGADLWQEGYTVQLPLHLSGPGSREEIQTGHNTDSSDPMATSSKEAHRFPKLSQQLGTKYANTRACRRPLNADHGKYVSEGHKH